MSSAPVAPKRPHVITQHDHTRVDDYFWMRYRDDPAVLDYLKTENDYLAEVMGHTEALQAQLFQEMKGRIKEDDASVPERQGAYFYYSRYAPGQQYPLYCRKHHTLTAPEEIILDHNVVAEGRDFCRLGAFAVSADGAKLAYSIDPDGSEKCLLYIKDLTTGALYPEIIPNTAGDVYSHSGIEWAADHQTLYYITRNAALRPDKIFRHRLGTDAAQDAVVYHEADETFFLSLRKMRSGAYLAAFSHATNTHEWRVWAATEPDAEPRLFEPRRVGHEYIIEHSGEQFFIVTNNAAHNFRLMSTSAHSTARAHWREVVPHRAEVLLENVSAFAHHLVLWERRAGLKQIRISALDGVSEVREVPFPEPVYSVMAEDNPEAQTALVRFVYSSLITPNSTIDFHMDTGEWELKKQTEIPSGHHPADYVTERLYATASDGVRVPMSLVYKKGLARDGQNPTLVYGYGSYGASVDASFNANRFSLIDRGFIIAIAHVRGGSELGRAWYDTGKMLNKRNTFTDFIACAEQLITEGYTRKEKLACMGGSAGGLLVSAAFTLRPDLFHAVIAQVAFVDVLSTMSDASIPLTAQEYTQWGNPEDRAEFEYMLSYSPYDNLRATAYPHLLLTTGLNDPRVAYWEPAKFAAKLRALKTDDHLLLLQTNMAAGHAGSSGRYDYLKEVALGYAFLVERLVQ